jgi:hypothetical protein
MIQIPGIKYGVKDVITLATLVNAIEDLLPVLRRSRISGLEAQTEFLAQCLTAWLEASGRFEGPSGDRTLDPENVADQGRVLVSVLNLVPAILWKLRRLQNLMSESAKEKTRVLLQDAAERAGLLDDNKVFIDKRVFKERKYLGSGGIALFRNTLWAAFGSEDTVRRWGPERIAVVADKVRAKVNRALADGEDE